MTTRILVPVDLRDIPTSEKVLKAGVQHAKAADGDLTVMTVVPNMITGIDYRYAIRGETGGSEDYDAREIVQEALARLNEIVGERTPSGMSTDIIVRHGTVYEEILEVAEEIKADQIVIGAHRPQVSDFLLGPNTARVVRHASCTVTVVRD